MEKLQLADGPFESDFIPFCPECDFRPEEATEFNCFLSAEML